MRDELSFVDLQRALDRCMHAHPPSGQELRLHPDANSMSDLWAPMCVNRITSVPIESVAAHVLDAFHRWESPAHEEASA